MVHVEIVRYDDADIYIMGDSRGRWGKSDMIDGEVGMESGE